MPKPAQSSAAARHRPRPSRTGLLARPAHIDLTVDRVLKQAWDEALRTLETSKREGSKAFDVQWETIGAIIEHVPPLYLAGGLSTTKDFLAKHVGETERSARRLTRVAKYASPNDENRYGISKLDAAIDYIEVKHGSPAKGRVPVAFDQLKIPVERKGQNAAIGLEEASVAEVKSATRKLLRAGRNKAASNVSPMVSAVIRELRGKLAGVTVRYAGGKLALGEIRPDALGDLAKALVRMKLPKTAVPKDR